MGYVGHWLHEHHVMPTIHWQMDWTKVTDVLRTQWVLFVLLVVGAMAVVTAILIAWPMLAYLGAKFFG